MVEICERYFVEPRDHSFLKFFAPHLLLFSLGFCLLPPHDIAHFDDRVSSHLSGQPWFDNIRLTFRVDALLCIILIDGE